MDMSAKMYIVSRIDGDYAYLLQENVQDAREREGYADGSVQKGSKNGSKEARTPDLSRVRRTLIPAELCFHEIYYNTHGGNCKCFVENCPQNKK